MMGPVSTQQTTGAPTSSAAFCPLHDAGACPSCPHMDLPLTDQLERKQARVAGLLADGANPVRASVWEPPQPSAPERFRNKAKMAVSGTVDAPVLGLADARGLSVDLRRCPLHVPAVEAALPVLTRLITELRLTPYDIAADRGELKHVLVTASPDGELMVRLVCRTADRVPDLRAALPRLREELPGLAVMSVNVQPVHQAVIEGPEEIVLADASLGLGDRLLMRLSLPETEHRPARELPLLLPTRSFFQTNTAVAEALYATAAEWSHDLTGTGGTASRPVEVWDLFCGVGGFGLALADQGRQVRGVEVSAPAIDGAREAARLMGLRPGEVDFAAGDARVLDPAAGAVRDLLVVNPPRRGIGADLAGRIEASGTPRVLYSSCNPVSLAKDLARMPSLRVRRARLFDMFPHTDHAEVLVELVH